MCPHSCLHEADGDATAATKTKEDIRCAHKEGCRENSRGEGTSTVRCMYAVDNHTSGQIIVIPHAFFTDRMYRQRKWEELRRKKEEIQQQMRCKEALYITTINRLGLYNGRLMIMAWGM